MWLGACTSSIGTWMQMVAQSWLVYRLTGSSFLLGAVGFASQIPVFLLAFIGGAVADRLGAGFCPIRKPGKLPAKTLRESFSLEYGTDAIEIHDDAIAKGQRVLIVDDVLATGGTARAAVRRRNPTWSSIRRRTL